MTRVKTLEKDFPSAERFCPDDPCNSSRPFWGTMYSTHECVRTRHLESNIFIPVVCLADLSKDVCGQPHFRRVVSYHAEERCQGNVLDSRELFGGELAWVRVEKPVGIPQNLQPVAVFLLSSCQDHFWTSLRCEMYLELVPDVTVGGGPNHRPNDRLWKNSTKCNHMTNFY